jgi:hypothetical protein
MDNILLTELETNIIMIFFVFIFDRKINFQKTDSFFENVNNHASKNRSIFSANRSIILKTVQFQSVFY